MGWSDRSHLLAPLRPRERAMAGLSKPARFAVAAQIAASVSASRCFGRGRGRGLGRGQSPRLVAEVRLLAHCLSAHVLVGRSVDRLVVLCLLVCLWSVMSFNICPACACCFSALGFRIALLFCLPSVRFFFCFFFSFYLIHRRFGCIFSAAYLSSLSPSPRLWQYS